jgi:hypothetical protein
MASDAVITVCLNVGLVSVTAVVVAVAAWMVVSIFAAIMNMIG